MSTEERQANLKVSRAAANKKWREKNKDHIKEFKHKWHQNKRIETQLNDRIRRATWLRNNPHKSAIYYIRRKYQLPTLKEAEELFHARNNGECVVCGVHQDRMHIDHCHKSGKIRGILCSGCNVALGQVQDNPATLRSLANYLEKHA